MVAMTTTTTGLPFGRPLTVDDLETMPDDGHRYELLDGTLLVSPGPSYGHQSMSGELYTVLRAACPRELLVLYAPFAVQLTRYTELQPDLLVARRADFTAKNLPTAPLLAVEIRSPSTALIDRTLKRAAYARHGVPSYWIVDPEAGAPSILTFELDGTEYVEAARAVGSELFAVTKPFALQLRPVDLVVRLG
jgi:Uma2 family endonuclease